MSTLLLLLLLLLVLLLLSCCQVHVGPLAHEILLPRCSLAIHHGGSGTTAAVLRAGIPHGAFLGSFRFSAKQYISLHVKWPNRSWYLLGTGLCHINSSILF